MTTGQDADLPGSGKEPRHRRATRQLRQAGALLFESSPTPVFLTNAKDRIIAWNPAAEQAFGYDAQTALKRSPRELLAVADSDAVWDAVHSKLHRGLGWKGVMDYADPTGRTIRVQTTVTPLFDSRRSLSGSQWEHRLGAALKAVDEANYRALLDAVPMAVFVYQDGRVRYVNAAAQKMTGYEEEELLAMGPWDVVHPDFREIVREWARARERGEPVPSHYEIRFLTKTGEEHWADYSAAPIQFYGRPAIMGMAVDITGRRRSP
jgi:PAS domain S-box-containing protein